MQEKQFDYQAIKGLLVLSVKRHSSTTDNFDCKKAAELSVKSTKTCKAFMKLFKLREVSMNVLQTEARL